MPGNRQKKIRLEESPLIPGKSFLSVFSLTLYHKKRGNLFLKNIMRGNHDRGSETKN